MLNGFDNYDIEIRAGTPYVEIFKFAGERRGDLIVMTHLTREVNPEESILGSTVEQVVLRAACWINSINHSDKVVDL